VEQKIPVSPVLRHHRPPQFSQYFTSNRISSIFLLRIIISKCQPVWFLSSGSPDPLCLSTHADRMPFDQILPRACNLDKGRKLLKRNRALSGALPAYGHEFDGSFKAGWFSMLGLRGEVCLVMGVQTVLMRHDAIAPKDSRTCDDPVQSTARSRLRNRAVRSLPVFCAQPSRWTGHTGTNIPMCLWPQPPRVVGHGQAKVFAQRLGFFHTSHLRVRMAGPPIC